MDFPPDVSIEDYAAIRDCRLLALVSRFGSIDWFCAPDFSSPSLFASLLDRDHGGCFTLAAWEIVQTRQWYEDGTNVLHTQFRCRTGVAQLTDFMTMPEAGGAGRSRPPPQEI